MGFISIIKAFISATFLFVLLVGCSFEKKEVTFKSSFDGLTASTNIIVDEMEDAEDYFLFFTIEVENKADLPAIYYIDVIPKEKKILNYWGDHARVQSFDGMEMPELFQVESKGKEKHQFTLSVPKKLMSYEEIKKASSQFQIKFTGETHSITF